MKIIFLGRYNPSENLRGPEKVAKRIFENVSAKNLDSVFIEYFFDGSEYNIYKKFFGIEKYNMNGEKILRLGLFRLLLHLIKEKPDIIHLVTFETFAFVVFIYKMISKVKIIYTVHAIMLYVINSLRKNLPYLYKLKNNYFEKIVVKYSDKIVFLSEVSLKFAFKYLDIDKHKVKIIPNGIDKIFSEIKHIQNKAENVPLKIVFVGDYFRIEKGFDFAINSLKDIEFNIELFVISESTDKYDAFSNLNLKIKFVEKLDKFKYANFFSDKDIIISSSFCDSFSISIAEAMAVGLLPIVTKETGVSEFINDGVNGFVFNYGDSNRLVEIITRINYERKILYEISCNARKIYEDISWEKVTDKYLLSYSDLLVS